MARLRKQIAAMKPSRDTMRKNRKRSKIPTVAIAGYTNAGKSSLLNRITRAGVLVENALFATLDPTVRKHQTEDGREYTIADTVGFVKSLPHQLVEAFRSTLEEIADADLILLVVDGSDPDPDSHIQTVRTVLAEVEATEIRELIVFNKSDLITELRRIELRSKYPDCIFVSAKSGSGISQLEQRIAEELPRPAIEFYGLIPYDRGDLVSRIHIRGEVLDLSYEENGTKVRALVGSQLADELAKYSF
jgi:GTP-binding protein HflX